MGKTMRRTPDSEGVKVRNWTAVDAHQRNSAGPMGGNKRTRARRDRAESRRAIQREDF